MAEDYAADVQELRELLGFAKRSRVQGLLRLQIDTLEKMGHDAASSEKRTPNAEPEPVEPKETPAVPIEDQEMLPVEDEKMSAEPKSPALEKTFSEQVSDKVSSMQALQKITKALDPYYITLSSFGWDQESDRVKIYISLEGASKDRIVADFKSNSFELKIHDVGGKNYRYGIPNLHKPVNPDNAVIAVKPKRIIVTLKKMQKENWPDIKFKEDKFKSKLDNDKDPMAGVMDLMKNMYEEGDDETKRTIAKAWSESRSGKKSDPMSMSDL